MNTDLERLIDLALVDGVISSKEKELIIKKAAQIGIDELEAEMIIEGKISELELVDKTSEDPTYGYLISDEELILRTTKWVNRVSEKNVKVEIEAFP